MFPLARGGDRGCLEGVFAMGQVYVLISRVTDPQARGFVFSLRLVSGPSRQQRKLRWPELPAHRSSAQGFVGGHLPALASGGYQRGRRLEEGLQRDQRVGLRAGPGAVTISHPTAGQPGALHPAEEQVICVEYNSPPDPICATLSLPRAGVLLFVSRVAIRSPGRSRRYWIRSQRPPP